MKLKIIQINKTFPFCASQDSSVVNHTCKKNYAHIDIDYFRKNTGDTYRYFLIIIVTCSQSVKLPYLQSDLSPELCQVTQIKHRVSNALRYNP